MRFFDCKIKRTDGSGTDIYSAYGNIYNVYNIFAEEALEVNAVFRNRIEKITDPVQLQNCPVPHNDLDGFVEALIRAYLNDDPSIEFTFVGWTIGQYKSMLKEKKVPRTSPFDKAEKKKGAHFASNGSVITAFFPDAKVQFFTAGNGKAIVEVDFCDDSLGREYRKHVFTREWWDSACNHKREFS